jgi:hypothetical protein
VIAWIAAFDWSTGDEPGVLYALCYHAGMSTSRKRRFVKRVAVALAGVVLMTAWYVASYGALWWYFGDDDAKGAVSPARHAAVMAHDVIYAPLREYEASEWPGAQFLRHFTNWCYCNGRSDTYVLWEDVNSDGGFSGGGFGQGGGFF